MAKKILELKKHKVDLGGECSIEVEARPVHLMLPEVVEVKQTAGADAAGGGRRAQFNRCVLPSRRSTPRFVLIVF